MQKNIISKFSIFEKSKIQRSYINWKYSKIGNPLLYVISLETSKGCFLTETIASNPNLTFDFVLNNLTLFKNIHNFISLFSQNREITPEIIEKNKDFPWDWRYISRNPNINISFVIRNKDKPWDWKYISKHKNVTVLCLEKYSNLPWKWEFVVENPNLTASFINKYYDKIKDYSFKLDVNIGLNLEAIYNRFLNNPQNINNKNLNKNVVYISSNTDKEIIEKFPELNWNWELISFNPTIDIDFVKKFKNKNLNWRILTMHSNITFSDIENNNDLPWWNNLKSLNPNTQIENLEKKPFNLVSFGNFLKHCQLSEKVLNILEEKSSDLSSKKFLCECLSSNPNLTLELVKKYKFFMIDIILFLNNFLFDLKTFCINFNRDINTKRNSFLKINIYGHVNKIIFNYIGYQ